LHSPDANDQGADGKSPENSQPERKGITKKIKGGRLIECGKLKHSKHAKQCWLSSTKAGFNGMRYLSIIYLTLLSTGN